MNHTGVYIGKVEKRVDPKRQGRLKVRIIGVHSDVINTDDLPWAYPETTSAHPKGGSHKIPPLYSYVTISFRNGDHEYPMWRGGWWAENETADGTSLSAHRISPTSWYGGNAGEGILQIDPDPDTDPKNQPNNYGESSFNNKRWELDDRKDQEKALFGDQLDNMLFINTEHGVITLEAGTGLQRDSYYKHGLTLSSEEKSVQLYTFKGWKTTINSPKGTFEVCSPNGHKIRIETSVEDDEKERIELWTQEGNRFILDEKEKIIITRTAGGRYIILDDEIGKGGLHVKTVRGYFWLDDEHGNGEFYVENDMRLKAGRNMSLSSGGKLTLDGAEGVFLCQDAPTLPAKGPNYNIDENPKRPRVTHTLPDNLSDIKRAIDYPYYEKT